MTTLSRGGVFIATESPLDIGTTFELRIELESSGELLELPVEVVSQNARPDRAVFEPGMGVRFRELDAVTREKVDRFYEGKLEEAGKRFRVARESGAERKSA